MLRWGLVTVLVLVLSILLLVTAILWLPSGTRFALNLVDSAVPGLELDGINGTLASDVRISRAAFVQDELALELTDVQLHWSLWALTEPRLAIHRLGAERLSVQLPEAAAEQTTDERPAAPLRWPQLPAVELPLALSIEQVQLGQVQVMQGEQTLVDELSVTLAVKSSGQLVQIESLHLQQPGTDLTLTGWTEPAQHFLTHLELQGSTELTEWVRLEHWPEQLPLTADLVLDLDGAAQALTLALTVRQETTRVHLQAQANGQPAGAPEAIEVAYQLSADGINPALAAPDWPGQLALEAQGHLGLGDALPTLALEISSLQGRLQQQPINAQAKLAGDTRQWQIDALQLNYAGARAEISGALSDRLALQWSLKAPNLARLLPTAKGALDLGGQVSGPLQQPAIQARLRATELAYADQARLQQLKGDIALDLSGQSDWSADLTLNGVEAAGQRIEQAALTLSGTPEQHRLTLTAQGSPGTVALAASGGWAATARQWSGQLASLELKPEPLSHWRSTAAAPLQLSPDGYRLGRFCLDEQSAGGTLCLQADGSFAGRTHASINLDQLSLSLLTPVLNGIQMTPTLSAEVDFRQQPDGYPELQATLLTSAGTLTPAQADQTLPLDPLEVRVRLADDSLNASATTALSFLSGDLALALDVRGLSGRQGLRGELNLNATDFDLISVLVPDVQNMQGRLNGQLTLGGTLSAPEVAGELAYREGGMELPAMGLVITPLELQLNQSGLPGQLRFSAAATSGEGTLKLVGDYDLAARAGQLSLQGDGFTAMNTPEIQALISPDLQLALGAREIRLDGTVKVPMAHISPPKSMESAVTPSADVVRVQDGQVVEKAPVVPVYADLRLELGDDVRVDALGFKGRLIGALQIEEVPGQITRATGSVGVESGAYRLYGQDLEIRRGGLVYAAGPVDNPGLDLRIGRQVEDVIVGANVSGTLREPRMDLYGEPAMPDSSVLSYLLLGKAPGASTVGEQQMLMQAALALGMSQGNKITGKLRESLSLDEFGFDSTANDESAFFIGKYLSPRLYLRYGIGVLDAVNTLSLRYKLSDKWRVEGQSSELGSGADILYTIER
ncbi:translocation/assembly module TamB domain-containing protein [Marinobacterium weihaiense]|nr:translocation/assembly module TamB domain-containing protein [Marinobacterium weihaiense]